MRCDRTPGRLQTTPIGGRVGAATVRSGAPHSEVVVTWWLLCAALTGSAEECVDSLDGLLVGLDLRDVSTVVEDCDLAAGDGVGKLAGVRDIH